VSDQQILKAGVLEASSFQETPEGSPQGGILSPLLANIYLHELDTWWWTRYGGLSRWEKTKRRQEQKGNCLLTRYADDFLLLCNGPRQEVERLRNEMRDFLQTELHLELSEDKTRITHATDGFDFLGYHICWETPANGKPWLRVTPTQKSVKRLKDSIRHMTRRAVGWEGVEEKIRAINRVLRGWGNYYRHVSWSRTRDDLDWWISQRMLIWLGERHKGMGKREILSNYYIRQGKRKNWGVWEAGNETFLHLLRDTKHSAYRKRNRGHPYLEEAESPFLEWQADSPHLKTWDGTANRAKAEWWKIRSQVLERDARQCSECGSIENLEVHHIKPSGGAKMENLTTLCQSCHARTPTYGRNRKQRQNGKKSTMESRMR
jgi:RNA-directed DNA polymerase